MQEILAFFPRTGFLTLLLLLWRILKMQKKWEGFSRSNKGIPHCLSIVIHIPYLTVTAYCIIFFRIKMRHCDRRKAPCITNSRLATLLTEKTIEDLVEKNAFFSVTTDDLDNDIFKVFTIINHSYTVEGQIIQCWLLIIFKVLTKPH